MSLRYVLAAVLLVGSTVGVSAQLMIPSDTTQAQKKKDSTDGLFNHKVPNRWENKSGDSSDLGGLHFTARSSNDLEQSGSYGDTAKPMSEFSGLKPSTDDNTDPSTSH